MSDRAEVAASIARAAGKLQRDRFNDPREIETKSTAIDLVTDVDKASEALIAAAIIEAFPDDGILGEEDTDRPSQSGYRWIVDPLDGTTNYAHGFPHYAVSIGIEHDGEREIGIVYDPMKDELFSASAGDGAELNDKTIRVSTTTELTRSLLATGFAYNVHEAEIDNLDYFVRFIKRARAVRRAGSAALDLAYVACGRFDGFWELGLHTWDVAAGYLIVQEAGGIASDLNGGPAPKSGERVLAANPQIHALMLKVLAEN